MQFQILQQCKQLEHTVTIKLKSHNNAMHTLRKNNTSTFILHYTGTTTKLTVLLAMRYYICALFLLSEFFNDNNILQTQPSV